MWLDLKLIENLLSYNEHEMSEPKDIELAFNPHPRNNNTIDKSPDEDRMSAAQGLTAEMQSCQIQVDPCLNFILC